MSFILSMVIFALDFFVADDVVFIKDTCSGREFM